MSLQHGVVKDDILRQVLGERCVVVGVCYIAATIAEPGVIRHTGSMQKLVFGEYDGSTSECLTRFRDTCAAAGIDHELRPGQRHGIATPCNRAIADILSVHSEGQPA